MTLLSSSPQGEKSAILSVGVERIYPRIKGKNPVEEVCKNCKYFVQVSFGLSKYVWGDCMKAASSIEADGKKKNGAFMWANKTCSDFNPKEEPK